MAESGATTQAAVGCQDIRQATMLEMPHLLLSMGRRITTKPKKRAGISFSVTRLLLLLADDHRSKAPKWCTRVADQPRIHPGV